MEHRLAAILHADVQGYSRLIGADEVATLHTLTPYLQMMNSAVQQHRGQAVGSRGDSLLAEFPSAVEAVQCAVDMQCELKVRNTELAVARRVEFRMGINLGEIVVEGDQLHGDGINIAVRLEGLAEAGGIYISEIVREQVRNRLPLRYEYVGEQALKNIERPVRVWRVVFDETSVSNVGAALRGRPAFPSPGQPHGVAPTTSEKPRVGTTRLSRTALVAVGLLILGALVTLLYSSRLPLSTQEAPALPLPDKPSIVVLPFVNMSGDSEQEYFSDGITEDLTTDLSRLSGLFVIARNSAFTYKGKAVKVQDVSRELGVRYVVEGSVRRDANQVRINTQLIDATTGGHVWSGRYDRELHGLFALQDEVRQRIVFALKVKLTPEEQERFRRFPTDNLEAYDFFLRGVESVYRLTKEANTQARQLFEKAIALDPQYAGANAWLGFTYYFDWLFHWNDDPQNPERAWELAQRARALDDSLPDVHQLLSFIYLRKQQPEQALAAAERALALDPNYVDSYQVLAQVLMPVGRPEEAIGLAEKAVRLNPRDPASPLRDLGTAYLLAGQVEEAIATLKQVLVHDPNHLFAYTNLALSYVFAWSWQLSQDSQTLEQAFAAAQQAVALNDSLPWAHSILGHVYLLQKQPEQARAEAERAIALDPSLADGYAALANILNVVGKPEEALGAAEKAVRLGFHPHWYLFDLGHAYCLSGRYTEAIATLKQFISRTPNLLHAQLVLAVAASEAGRDEETRAAAAEVLRINPKFSLEVMRQRAPYTDPTVVERQVVALRKAGLK